MSDLYEFQNDTIKSCDKLMDQSGMSQYEMSEALKEIVNDKPDLKDFCEEHSPYFIRTRIFALKTQDEILIWYKTFGDLVILARKYRDEKKLEEQKKKQDEDLEWWKNHNRQLADITDRMKQNNQRVDDIIQDNNKKNQQDQKLIDEINQNKGDNPSTPTKSESFDEKSKKQDIEDIEFKLRLKKVEEAKINQELGVSDWRTEITKTSDWRQSQQRRFAIEDLIEKQAREYKCARCGEVDDSYFPYKKGGKKYCSYECRYKEDNGKLKVGDIEEIIKAFQNWMKKSKIEKISYSASGELMIKFEGQAEEKKSESQLSKEEKEIKSFLKTNPQAKEIKASGTFEYNPSSPNKSKGNNTGLILGSLVIVGIVAIIIAVIVNKRKEKNY